MINIQIKSNLKLIGSGGNSKVYECCIVNYAQEKKVIIKVGSDTKKNITNYNLIKSLKLPTVCFVEEGIFNNKLSLITEHLNINNENLIYVSPNSVITKSQREVNMLNEFKKREDLIEPVAENFRYNNKLNEIINLNEFINNTILDLKRISHKKVIIEYDSYFISSKKDSSISELNYKIADFDNIYECKDYPVQKCFNINKSEFEKMILQYIMHFVSEGQNKENYKKIIKNIA